MNSTMSDQTEATEDATPEQSGEQPALETTFTTYSIGTTVYYPSVERKDVPVQCPDCKGKKTWMVYTGERYKHSFNVPCPRCTRDGREHDWLQPKRVEFVLEINEQKITGVEVACGPRWGGDGSEGARIRYAVGRGYERAKDEIFLTREEAEIAGAALLAKHEAREKTQWEKDIERNGKYAGLHILQALQAKSARNVKTVNEKIDKLKALMLDAIRNEEGPAIDKPSYGSPRITQESLTDWFTNMLSEADIDVWTEEELHEATCHC